jgi:hypothetical protein
VAGLEHPTLLAAAFLAAGVALVYVQVGRVLVARQAAGEMRRALALFALWWVATAVNILLGSAMNAAAAFGWTSLPAQLTYIILQRILLAVALVGLLHYLLVLVRGRSRLDILMAVYLGYLMFLVATVYRNEPSGVFVGDWRTDLEYARPASPGIVDLVSFLFLIVPTIGLSIAALVVARRLPPSQRAQRNRISLVGLALIVWWLVAVLAGQRQALDQDWYQVFNRVLDLGMALIILVAYKTPAWLRRFIELPVDQPAASADAAKVDGLALALFKT